MARSAINQFKPLLLSDKHIGIDSMCFIYHFSRHKLFSPLTTILFSLLEQKGIFAVTSLITVTEVFVQAERAGDRLLLYEYERFFHSFENLTLIPVDWYIARMAARLRSDNAGLRTPDAVQVAAALISGCKAFVTNDKRLRKLKEIKVVILEDFI